MENRGLPLRAVLFYRNIIFLFIISVYTEDKKPSRSGWSERRKTMDFSEGIKNIFLAGVGAMAVTGEKSKKMLDELVKKGELTVEEGKTLNEELKHKMDEKSKDVKTEKTVQNFHDAVSAVEKLTKEERDALRAKLDKADAAAKKCTEQQSSSEKCGDGKCSEDKNTEQNSTDKKDEEQ